MTKWGLIAVLLGGLFAFAGDRSMRSAARDNRPGSVMAGATLFLGGVVALFLGFTWMGEF